MELTWKNVWLILHREVRDQLRDRRTLFMVLVLPIMLYPGLGIGMLQMTMYFTEQPRQVVILNAGELPDPPLVENGRFPARWFSSPETASKLRVLTDSPDDLTRLPELSVDEQKQLLEKHTTIGRLTPGALYLYDRRRDAPRDRCPCRAQAESWCCSCSSCSSSW